jgi:hypothetical protein
MGNNLWPVADLANNNKDNIFLNIFDSHSFLSRTRDDKSLQFVGTNDTFTINVGVLFGPLR